MSLAARRALRLNWSVPETDPICPLCLRPIPGDARQSRHRLVPRLKGGGSGPTVLLHQICHDQIHAHLTEAQLARSHATPGALRSHPQLAKFIAWIASKPPTYHARTPGPRRRRR